MDSKHPVLPPFYQRYVALAAAVSLPKMLGDGGLELQSYASAWTDEQAAFRYAPGKWTAREVLLHLIDAERIFAARALRFARADQTPLPGFDENAYAEHYSKDTRSVKAIVSEMKILRESTIALFSAIPAAAMERQGTASHVQMSVRTIGEIIVGHEKHHLKVLKEKYFPN